MALPVWIKTSTFPGRIIQIPEIAVDTMLTLSKRLVAKQNVHLQVEKKLSDTSANTLIKTHHQMTFLVVTLKQKPTLRECQLVDICKAKHKNY